MTTPTPGTENPFAGVCAPRAELLGQGPAFVRGWARSRRATGHLADRLAKAGLDVDFSGLRADVSVTGDGVVCIGTVTASAAEQLATLLLRGLCAELEPGAEERQPFAA